MCTILTFSREFFNTHQSEVVAQLDKDAFYNRDGFTLITCGKYSEDATILKAKSIEPIQSQLIYGDWERAWVHCRASTTANETLADCHGYPFFVPSGKRNEPDQAWFVLHNGILSGYGADYHRVDSELIAEIAGKYGTHAAVSHLWQHQTFANVFLVCPESGEWVVVRSTGGTLHTDGNGNYSTRSFGPLTKAVEDKAFEQHKEKTVPPAFYRRSTPTTSPLTGGDRTIMGEVPGGEASKMQDRLNRLDSPGYDEFGDGWDWTRNDPQDLEAARQAIRNMYSADEQAMLDKEYPGWDDPREESDYLGSNTAEINRACAVANARKRS